jgi:hypothetical protein
MDADARDHTRVSWILSSSSVLDNSPQYEGVVGTVVVALSSTTLYIISRPCCSRRGVDECKVLEIITQLLNGR